MKKAVAVLVLFVAVLGVAAALIGAHILDKRRSIYAYDVTADHAYDFTRSAAETTILDSEAGLVLLPQAQGPVGAAFLELEVSATVLGRYLQPELRVSAGDAVVTEAIEHGAQGKRYVNISSLLPGAYGQQIRIEGRNLTVTSEKVALIRFPALDLGDKTVLVLASHPDDAEIAAFALYSDVPGAYIVTITAGDAGGHTYKDIYPDRQEHFIKKGQLRTWDSITVPLMGGVPPERAVNLGFFDGTLPKMFQDKATPVEAAYIKTADIGTFRRLNLPGLANGLTGTSSWDSLVANLSYILAEVRPDIIVTPYPLLDSHPDHQLTTVALLEAIHASGLRDGALFLYTNHLTDSEFYPYGEIGGPMTLPANSDPTLYFDSILSHPLSKAKQNDKLLALEAMHDLRPATEVRFFKGALKLALHNLQRDIYGQDVSYYRRAVRSNELFFIVDVAKTYDQTVLEGLLRTGKAATPSRY
ncbi:PIG-L family deacetylase [Rhodobacter sp. Har01]|uniref:PIG-L deacetylase family protein n=1 Tax=Rhodobacter sp. Har01 TaxID=2883999 RepID=UPI001D094683|nr:PIG-L family deacetylase [Rhodobacter sp. Har01]MCB6180119.1 PIG-L family deacetylase [Rhodobacter sp. Har01]